MDFPNFIGIGDLRNLTSSRFNQAILSIRSWWNEHNEGRRKWDNVNAVASTIDGLTATAAANIAMGGFKLTGLGAGSSAGDSLRYEQLQFLQKVEGSTTSLTTTSSATYADATNYNVTITPKFSSSIIKLTATIFGLVGYSATGKCELAIQMVRGASTVVRDFDTVMAGGSASGPTDNAWGIVTLIAYDSPATTSATTYKIQLKNRSGGSAAINDNTFSTHTSYLLAEEIGQ